MADFKQYELEPQPSAELISPAGGRGSQLSSLQESGADLVLTRGNIRSRNFTKGQSGWRIDEQGNADFLSTTVIGTPTTSTTVYNLTVVGGSAGVAGSDTQVQFNDSGAFGAGANFIWNKTNDILTIGAANGVGTIATPGGTGSQAGGDLTLDVGEGGTTGDGGDINLQGGQGGASSGAGGRVVVQTGNATAGTEKNGTFVISTNSSGVVGYSHRIAASLTTTNATPTVFPAKFCPGIPISGNGVFIEARVYARRTGGTAGTTNDAAAYVRRATYVNKSDVLTLIGSIQDDYTVEDQVGWDVTFTTSGTNVLPQVTGAVNNNITWNFELTYISSSVNP